MKNQDNCKVKTVLGYYSQIRELPKVELQKQSNDKISTINKNSKDKKAFALNSS
ncbi:MAG: hypothetical protein GY795_05385 [Desulfobacterales bacterium]|nr:hypothetical protein [Desulfobacterales bacterium]